MTSYTQDAVNSIWKKLADEIELDQDDLLDVSEFVSEFLLAKILTDEDLEQSLELHTVAPYSNSNDSTTVSYTRERLNNEAAWGKWESRN